MLSDEIENLMEDSKPFEILDNFSKNSPLFTKLMLVKKRINIPVERTKFTNFFISQRSVMKKWQDSQFIAFRRIAF